MMEVDRNRFDEVVRQGLAFVLRLALVLGGLGFASVFAVALLGGVSRRRAPFLEYLFRVRRDLRSNVDYAIILHVV